MRSGAQAQGVAHWHGAVGALGLVAGSGVALHDADELLANVATSGAAAAAGQEVGQNQTHLLASHVVAGPKMRKKVARENPLISCIYQFKSIKIAEQRSFFVNIVKQSDKFLE